MFGFKTKDINSDMTAQVSKARTGNLFRLLRNDMDVRACEG
jgi:hypothetical protein